MKIFHRTAALLLVLGVATLAWCEDLAAYKSRLDHYDGQVSNLTVIPQSAVGFYGEVPSSVQVETRSGSIDVSFEFLRKGLENFLESSPSAKQSTIGQLSQRLKTMRHEADRFEQAHEGDPAMRERLNHILAAREFRRVHGPTEWELLQERIRDWFERKLNKLFPHAPDLDQLGQVFVWILIAVVTSILGVWLYRRSKERLESPREVVHFAPSARGWRSWLAEAREKAALGQWRDAIHLGFWAAVARLETDGVWRPDKARTPREYLNAIPATSESRSPFATLTRTFEAAWYGGRPASEPEFHGFLRELEKLGCRE